MSSRLLLIGLVLSCLGHAQTLDRLDQQAGWAGIRLEANSDTIAGLQRVGYVPATQRRVGRWIRPADEAWAGPAGIQRVSYGIFRSQVHSITLQTQDLASSQQLLRALEEAFGPGRQTGRAPHYVWQSQYVRLEYDQNLLTGRATATFLSIPVQRAVETTWAD